LSAQWLAYDERVRFLWIAVALLILTAGAVVVWPTGHPPTTVAPAVIPPSAVITGPPPETPQLETIERIDDRTLRIDGQFTVRGSGSRNDPYHITWELLNSARTTIDAQKERFDLPSRLIPLQGAWVEISGYWAPPLQRFETKEVMLMMNRWDGCCLGLPPTPFDSIDVTLVNPMVIQGQHLFRFGTLRGRLRIEPFSAAGFLLGLYQLEEAVMEST
jgi:hypothetical protein